MTEAGLGASENEERARCIVPLQGQGLRSEDLSYRDAGLPTPTGSG